MKQNIELDFILQFNNHHYSGDVFYCNINGKDYNFVKGYLTYNPRKYENSNYNVKNNNCGTYLIRELNTGKLYVGSSGRVYKRISRHKEFIISGKHDNSNFDNLLKTTNIKDYELIVFFTANREEAYSLEQYFVDKYQDTGFLINIANDVKLARLGSKNTPEHNKIIGEYSKNRIYSDEDRKNISNIRKTNLKSIEQFKKVLNSKKIKISVFGVEYESITEAGLESPYSESYLRRQIKKGSKDIFYLSDNQSPLKGRNISLDKRQLLSDIRKTNPKLIAQFNSIRELTKKKIRLNGVLYNSVGQASKENGISESVIFRKLRESKNKEVNGIYFLDYVKPQTKKIEVDGVIYDSVAIAAKTLNINKSTLKNKISLGKIKYV